MSKVNLKGPGLPEQATGISIVKDENGNDVIILGFSAHREIISEIGFVAHPDLAENYLNALTAVTDRAKDQKTMEAWLMKPADFESFSAAQNQESLDPEALSMAIHMLQEALKCHAGFIVAERNRQKEKTVE